MSLIPYQPREGREIVLRHNNAIVVRDSTSHRLEIRGVSECPTCHQPLTRPSPTEQPYTRRESYVDPDYFRMLRASSVNSVPESGPPSPVRRPALAAGTPRFQAAYSQDAPDGDAEFISSTPGLAQADGSRIRRDAFSPNYFETFFVEERVLGKGGKGVVLLVRHEIDGCHLGQFACKRVPVGDDHAWLEKVLIEVELLAKLSHPNLVSYRHVWLEDVKLNRFAPEVACAFILQQYCNGGDLHQYVVGGPPREATKEELKAQMRRRSKGQLEVPVDMFSGHRRLSFDEIYSLFKDITSGVAYLHAANYIHRDLKPSNCLIHREGGRVICLISDFGEVQPGNVIRNSTGTTGTISYCAPEVLKSDTTGRFGNFTTKSDVFSLGMILYFMCFGRLPYRSANTIQEELEDVDELREEITHWQGFQDERRERPDLPSKLYQLLKILLALNPAERPSANEVLKVMRGESDFDGLAREDHGSGPAIALNGSRVQSLDSPAIPGSPIPAARKHSAPNALDKFQELGQWNRAPRRGSSPLASGRSSFQEEEQSLGARHRHSQSLVVSRSQDAHRRASIHDSRSGSEPQERDTFTPPLLMAPPDSQATTFSHKLEIIVFRAWNLMQPLAPTLGYFVRLAIFVAKMISLARPCWPYMVSLRVGVPLVAVAALDLGLPQLGTAYSYSRSRRTWGIATSLALLALHFSVLWMTPGWANLCAMAPHDPWRRLPIQELGEEGGV